MIVLKFGGTSVGNAERVSDAASIIELQDMPRAAVVSAASGVTNLLLEAANAAATGDVMREASAVAAIHAKHADVLAGISVDSEREGAERAIAELHWNLATALADIVGAGELSKRDSDRIVATGEKSMSVMMAATLRSRGTPATHVFADTVIATDDRFGSAKPDRVRTREQAAAVIRPLLDAGHTVVMTGFLGGAPDGTTTTLGRGGSDYSATLLGAALDATEVQIWTDVPGVLSADPRQVADARVVPSVSYDEAQELAHFGAKVLHPRTIRPAVALDIPVRILSTFLPHEPGTLVTRSSSGDQVKAVTALKNLMLLTIDVPELEDLASAASSVFGALHEERIEIIHVSQASSRRRMTYLVDAGPNATCAIMRDHVAEALADFEADVRCNENVAVLAAVGDVAASQPATLGRMLGVLDRAAIPVLASSQQSSNVAIVAVVPAHQADRAVELIHATFIGPQAASAKGRRPRRARVMAESLRVG
jgi:aspartokinase/homoserine dehydrogenase 1